MRSAVLSLTLVSLVSAASAGVCWRTNLQSGELYQFENFPQHRREAVPMSWTWPGTYMFALPNDNVLAVLDKRNALARRCYYRGSWMNVLLEGEGTLAPYYRPNGKQVRGMRWDRRDVVKSDKELWMNGYGGIDAYTVNLQDNEEVTLKITSHKLPLHSTFFVQDMEQKSHRRRRRRKHWKITDKKWALQGAPVRFFRCNNGEAPTAAPTTTAAPTPEPTTLAPAVCTLTDEKVLEGSFQIGSSNIEPTQDPPLSEPTTQQVAPMGKYEDGDDTMRATGTFSDDGNTLTVSAVLNGTFVYNEVPVMVNYNLEFSVSGLTANSQTLNTGRLSMVSRRPNTVEYQAQAGTVVGVVTRTTAGELNLLVEFDLKQFGTGSWDTTSVPATFNAVVEC